MKSGYVSANGINLAHEQFGRDDDPAVLLIMGNSAPGLVWPDAFCKLLSDAGFRVIRYDQRDTGLSTYCDFDVAPYRLNDLVADAFSLLDGLGIQAAHFVGLSQGGSTAMMAGLQIPSRVKTITTIMSSPDLAPKNDAFTGRPEKQGQLPRPAADYVDAVIALNTLPTQSDEEAAERFMENFRLAAGARSPFDEKFWLGMGSAVAARRHASLAKMANHSNHSKAQMATVPLTADDLARLTLPCLVIHGDGDPIFPLAHAEWAASCLPDARLQMIADMGHALDPAFFAAVAEPLLAFVAEHEKREVVSDSDSSKMQARAMP